jgi:septum formation protein
LTEVVDTQVQFRELSPEMIEAYIATGEPFDKAGAYGIQGYASLFVEAIYGDYFNVVGLPVSTVARMLEKIGIRWWESPASLNERPRFSRQP